MPIDESDLDYKLLTAPHVFNRRGHRQVVCRADQQVWAVADRLATAKSYIQVLAVQGCEPGEIEAVAAEIEQLAELLEFVESLAVEERSRRTEKEAHSKIIEHLDAMSPKSPNNWLQLGEKRL